MSINNNLEDIYLFGTQLSTKTVLSCREVLNMKHFHFNHDNVLAKSMPVIKYPLVHVIKFNVI